MSNRSSSVARRSSTVDPDLEKEMKEAVARGDHETMMKLASIQHKQKKHDRQILVRVHRAVRGATVAIVDGIQAIVKSGVIFEHDSTFIFWWCTIIVIGAMYSAVVLPLALVLIPRGAGMEVLDCTLDLMFMADIAIRMRTSYRDHGYDVTRPYVLFVNYAKGWLLVDVLGAIPFSLLLLALGGSGGPPQLRPEGLRPLEWVGLLRLLRIFRLARQPVTNWLSDHEWLSVPGLVILFVLLAHWLGLIWYDIAISPLQDLFPDLNSTGAVFGSETTWSGATIASAEGAAAAGDADKAGQWIWLDEDNSEQLMIRYVCSLYWALTVMTNLKGFATHETRQCLWHDPLITHPLGERVFTICTFIIGAVFFSVIYGNIAQFIQNLYAAGTRYRQRIGDLKEFASFHRLSPALRQKIFNYVDFQWSVTNGIDVDKIAAGLPAHLQLEMKVQLNKALVEQVTLFVGCPKAFFEALVCKLQPCICIQDDYVFYKGEYGTSMYFLRRGRAEVVTAESVVLATLREGDYFGEMALLADAPRSADVRAGTDLVMLSLSSEDLNEVLEVYPQARVRMRAAAADRLKALEKQDKSKAKEEKQRSRAKEKLQDAGNRVRRSSQRARRGSWGSSELSSHGAIENALSMEPSANMRRRNSDEDLSFAASRVGSIAPCDPDSFGRRSQRGARRGSVGARSVGSVEDGEDGGDSPEGSMNAGQGGSVLDYAVDHMAAIDEDKSRQASRAASIITPLSSFKNTRARRNSVPESVDEDGNGNGNGKPPRRGSVPSTSRRGSVTNMLGSRRNSRCGNGSSDAHNRLIRGLSTGVSPEAGRRGSVPVLADMQDSGPDTHEVMSRLSAHDRISPDSPTSGSPANSPDLNAHRRASGGRRDSCGSDVGLRRASGGRRDSCGSVRSVEGRGSMTSTVGGDEPEQKYMTTYNSPPQSNYTCMDDSPNETTSPSNSMRAPRPPEEESPPPPPVWTRHRSLDNTRIGLPPRPDPAKEKKGGYLSSTRSYLTTSFSRRRLRSSSNDRASDGSSPEFGRRSSTSEDIEMLITQNIAMAVAPLIDEVGKLASAIERISKQQESSGAATAAAAGVLEVTPPKDSP